MKISLPVVGEPQGVIIYRGPSMLNGKPIVVVVTGLKANSKNGKTGKVVQVYILADGIKPLSALFNGQDEAVCGDCLHRYVDGSGTCYVNPINGPGGVYRAIEANKYPYYTPQNAAVLVSGSMVRLGAYGDPAAVPITVWDALLVQAKGWLGYTHQWRKAVAKGLNRYCMASVETQKQAVYARRKGWRSFRIRSDSLDELLPNEFQCPASEEEGKRKTCEECGACCGGNAKKASVAIIAHGTNWKKVRLKRVIKALKQKKRLHFPMRSKYGSQGNIDEGKESCA